MNILIFLILVFISIIIIFIYSSLVVAKDYDELAEETLKKNNHD